MKDKRFFWEKNNKNRNKSVNNNGYLQSFESMIGEAKDSTKARFATFELVLVCIEIQ